MISSRMTKRRGATMRPLPNKRNVKPFDEYGNLGGSNPGLVWAKFCDRWESTECKPLGAPEKLKWIKKFTKTVENPALLTRAAERQKALTESLGGHHETFTSDAPFVTGMGLEHPVENGFVWHHTLGVPCLPASSVKGLVRAWAEHWLKEDQGAILRIFGDAAEGAGVGSVIVFDALPVAPVALMAEVLTPHDGGWRQGNAAAPSDWHSPVPIPFLAVAPEAKFLFSAAPRPGAATGAEDAKTFMAWLAEALQWLGAGAKTSVGFGRFLNDEARARQAQERKEAEHREAQRREEMAKNAPPRVGERMQHDEWGLVEIKSISGDMARVYAIEEAEETDLPVNELKRP